MKAKTAVRLLKTAASLPFREEALLLTAGASVFAADRVLKDSVEQEPDKNFPRDAGRLVRVEKVHNPGLPMGALKEHRELVYLLSGSALSAVLAKALAGGKRQGFFARLGLALAAGGGFSNLYDRLKYGYVVDYLCIKKSPLDRIVMNIGDLAVFSGSLLALTGEGRRGKGKSD